MVLLDPAYELSHRLKAIEAALIGAATSPTLLNASTGTGTGSPGITIDTNGVHAFDSTGKNLVGVLTADGSVTAYDANGNPVARFGPLTQSHPGSYGIEVLINGAWTQVGAGNADWANITNKPATFPPSAHTHAGTDITSAVANATNATNATQATNSTNADGSAYAYNNNVPGTSFFAVWVGNDANNHFGKNTSSARVKANIRRHRIHPDRVLALQPVLYEKPANGHYTEYGLIAEQVAETMPELVQWLNGRIEAVRYDLLSVALLDVVKDQQARIEALEAKTGTAPAAQRWHGPARGANNPPPHPETPHPYTIEGQD